ncbi:MAG: aminotransferase class I/II-fold pyridoxal phosphate-dependent enzyme [Calditrichaeota bacterium]|nr:aminotransferase class I/II-fold pyridoxal phosphate-dependent enzyme [Calditrichota bacterium]MCB9367886.1 aminotransferase class I/II-fold pyridoxal phosphate-dependent enzyme [Calditrichota bacterium]
MTRSELDQAYALWRGSSIQEWAKSTLTGPTPSLARSAVPMVKSLSEIPGGPYKANITGKNAYYGHPELKARIAQLYDASPEEVLLAQGASQVNFLIAGALLEHGGEAIVESPVYEPIVRGIEMLADKVKVLKRKPTHGFQPGLQDLKSLISRDTKLVWLTNLHNPTQVELDTEVLRECVEMCRDAGAALVVDEVYLNFTRPDFRSHAFTYGGISVNSLDKTWGLDSLRVGWAVAPSEIVDRAYKFNNLMGVTQPYVTEDLANQILRDDSAVEWFKLRRNTSCGQFSLLTSFLKRTPELELLPPSGGVNACLKLPEGLDDRRFVEALWKVKQVRVFPGSLFELPGYIRVSVGCDPVETRLHLGELGDMIREYR